MIIFKCSHCEEKVNGTQEEKLIWAGTRRPLCDKCKEKLKKCKTIEEKFDFWGEDI